MRRLDHGALALIIWPPVGLAMWVGLWLLFGTTVLVWSVVAVAFLMVLVITR